MKGRGRSPTVNWMSGWGEEDAGATGRWRTGGEGSEWVG